MKFNPTILSTVLATELLLAPGCKTKPVDDLVSMAHQISDDVASLLADSNCVKTEEALNCVVQDDSGDQGFSALTKSEGPFGSSIIFASSRIGNLGGQNDTVTLTMYDEGSCVIEGGGFLEDSQPLASAECNDLRNAAMTLLDISN